MSDYQAEEMSSHQAAQKVEPGSSWATGGVILAAVIMIMFGVFEAFQGLAAIINDDFFVTVDDYAYEIDLTAWGWIHLIAGVLVAIAGFFLFSGSSVAGIVAIGLAGLAGVANFFFVPYYPLWSLLMIALAVYVIWAIARSGILRS